jgi:hypothetical protein
VARVAGASCPAKRAERLLSATALSGKSDLPSALSLGIKGVISVIDSAILRLLGCFGSWECIKTFNLAGLLAALNNLKLLIVLHKE